MKILKLLSGLVISLALVSVAFAQYGHFSFGDVTWEDEGDQWFYEAVYNLYNKGIVEGYDDGNFHPQYDVNRAELAVMLDRFDSYLEHPKGEGDWGEFSNGFYTVWHPETELGYNEDPDDSCGSALSGEQSNDWIITCFDKDDYSLEELVATAGGYYEDGQTKSISEEELVLNGQDATRLVVTSPYGPTYLEMVLVEGDENIYHILNGQYWRDPDFELFYRSFKLN